MSQPYDNQPPRMPPPQRTGTSLAILFAALLAVVAALSYFVFGTDQRGDQTAQTGASTTAENTAEAPAIAPNPAPNPIPGQPSQPNQAQ
ncbi:hypothetical protein [Rhodoligotrophos ferricapiens]|uniref:hypothetical protein n=1 Tax=Rhodoligotrophos ferricapiens TaxID=3069264 RepID=UPI00315D24FD